VLDAMKQQLPDILLRINDTGKATIREANLTLYIREGRDPDIGRFNLFEFQWRRRNDRQPDLKCFLGHRFTPSICNSLRNNLRYIMEPLNIFLRWSGMDMNASGFFDGIVRLIRCCDFCIFDNRDTDGRPNVYIEAGIAYVLKRPFILANCKRNCVGVPSDLTHILNVPYDNYRDLSQQLYFNLPVFLRNTRLR